MCLPRMEVNIGTPSGPYREADPHDAWSSRSLEMQMDPNRRGIFPAVERTVVDPLSRNPEHWSGGNMVPQPIPESHYIPGSGSETLRLGKVTDYPIVPAREMPDTIFKTPATFDPTTNMWTEPPASFPPLGYPMGTKYLEHNRRKRLKKGQYAGPTDTVPPLSGRTPAKTPEYGVRGNRPPAIPKRGKRERGFQPK